jgi:hypothetical protein
MKATLLEQLLSEQEAFETGVAILEEGQTPVQLTASQLRELQTSIEEREAKLAQLDALLTELETTISRDFAEMRRTLEDEKRENEALGFSGPEGERLLAQAEAELDDQEAGAASEKRLGPRRRAVLRAPSADLADEDEYDMAGVSDEDEKSDNDSDGGQQAESTRGAYSRTARPTIPRQTSL